VTYWELGPSLSVPAFLTTYSMLGRDAQINWTELRVAWSLKWYSSVALANKPAHRCRSRQILGSAKDFCPNFPKLTRKVLCDFWLQIFCLCVFCKRWAPFFFNQPFLPAFLEFYPDFQVFCPEFQGFCSDFQGFYPDFRQIKTFGGAFARPAPPPPTPLSC